MDMTDIEVRMPERARASSSFSSKKPMAEVTCTLEDGRTREIVVPARVGRILRDEGVGLPRPEDEAFDTIHALEYRMCLTMLTEMQSRRDHSEGEAKDKLSAYGFRPEELNACITRAKELRILDDARFSAYFIDERKRRGWGRRKVEIELNRRHVDLEQIPGYPEAYFDEDDDRARAMSIVARKPVPEVRAFEKLVRHLMSKGFPYALAADVVRERIDGSDDPEF